LLDQHHYRTQRKCECRKSAAREEADDSVGVLIGGHDVANDLAARSMIRTLGVPTIRVTIRLALCRSCRHSRFITPVSRQQPAELAHDKVHPGHMTGSSRFAADGVAVVAQHETGSRPCAKPSPSVVISR